MTFLFCVRECDGVVDVEDVDACASSHLNTVRLRRVERTSCDQPTGPRKRREI